MKKETLAQMFSCQFCKIFRSNVFKEHIWRTAFGLNFVNRRKKSVKEKVSKILTVLSF